MSSVAVRTGLPYNEGQFSRVPNMGALLRDPAQVLLEHLFCFVDCGLSKRHGSGSAIVDLLELAHPGAPSRFPRHPDFVNVLNMPRWILALVCAAILSAGCASSSRRTAECVSSADCASGLRCVDGYCVGDEDAATDSGAPTDAVPIDTGVHPDTGSDAAPPPMCLGSGDCDDGNACTVNDCVASICTGAPVDCDDGDACTVDMCASASGCMHEAMVVPGATCATAIDVSAAGTFTGDTACGTSDVTGGCGGSDAADVVFVFTLAAPQQVTLDASATSFSTTLFLGASCGVDDAGCDEDGTPVLTASLAAGTYYAILDGATIADVGAFSLSVTIAAVSTETVTFPDVGDTRVTNSSDNFWNVGDHVEGSRTTAIATLTSVALNLMVSPNALTCDDQDMALSINGVSVGAVIIAPGVMAVTPVLAFTAITGPTYTFRLDTTRTVNSGCGSAGLLDGSTIVLNPAP